MGYEVKMRQPTSAMEILESILVKRLNRRFKRIFTGFLRMKKERTEQETVKILEDTLCIDTETARESLEAMVYLWENDLNVTQEVSIFNPYPGTVFYENPKKYNLKILTKDWEKYSRFDEGIISLDYFPQEKLNEFFEEARKIANFWPSLRRYLELKKDFIHNSNKSISINRHLI